MMKIDISIYAHLIIKYTVTDKEQHTLTFFKKNEVREVFQ